MLLKQDTIIYIIKRNVINDFMQQISAGTEVKSGIYIDETIPSHQYRINIFTKCRRQ